MLRAKSLTVNDCCGVAGFSDLSSISCGSCSSSRQLNVFAPPFLPFPDGYFYTASEAANDQNQQNVADCCRCVAGGKGQRNPCKMGIVAVLPIFRTSIYQSRVSGQFFSRVSKKDAQKQICALFTHPFFCCQRLYYWHRPKRPMP